jgi:protein HIRA/HIR1
MLALIDGNVKIWNTEPIFNEEAENDDNVHKLLCTMTMHNGKNKHVK